MSRVVAVTGALVNDRVVAAEVVVVAGGLVR